MACGVVHCSLSSSVENVSFTDLKVPTLSLSIDIYIYIIFALHGSTTIVMGLLIPMIFSTEFSSLLFSVA